MCGEGLAKPHSEEMTTVEKKSFSDSPSRTVWRRESKFDTTPRVIPMLRSFPRTRPVSAYLLHDPACAKALKADSTTCRGGIPYPARSKVLATALFHHARSLVSEVRYRSPPAKRSGISSW
jgi:hypothetical protein